jgi:hypothetical protein
VTASDTPRPVVPAAEGSEADREDGPAAMHQVIEGPVGAARLRDPADGPPVDIDESGQITGEDQPTS